VSRPTNSVQRARDRVKLWFFRDITDAHRVDLLKLFDLPADEMSTHGAQAVGLRYVFDALLAAEASGTDWQTEEVMQIEAVQHGHAHDPAASAADGRAAAPYTPPDGKIACPIPTCRAELLAGQYCGGVNCGLRGKE